MNQKNYSNATVWLVDDDPAVLSMLQALVGSLNADVRGFSSANDFLAAYQPRSMECLVCDLRMPDMDGIDLQRQLKAMGVTLPILFLTGHAEVDVAVQAMRDGAFDFVQKPFSARAMLAKIQGALAMSQAQHKQGLELQTRQARIALLTPRELIIVQGVVGAKSSSQIAEELGLSVRTVENQRTRIMEKLHVDSAIELVKLFV
jgi:FixJ family two-component response regulator